eukprot:TRINITY_DN4120_c0_g4_i2.p1 TRINITY_DN4120_c0_g4~~TRINITY_DN4120_c0_g4_i2.p1  ORF type:complete len:960 (-),score=156.12 TRINITY_DN4120_c0_g4_i2:205-3084(-)
MNVALFAPPGHVPLGPLCASPDKAEAWEEMTSMLEPLRQSSSLAHVDLDLGGRALGPTGAMEVRNALATLRQLQELNLNLSWNELGEHGALTIVSLFPHLKALSHLSLNIAGNNSGDVAVRGLISALDGLPRLSRLNIDVSLNGLGSRGVCDIANVIARQLDLTHLELELGWNTFSQQSAVEMISAIGKLPSLTVLKLGLAGNDVGEIGCSTLARALSQMPNLCVLDLDLGMAPAHTRGVREIALSIGRLPLLSHLSLRDGARNIQENIMSVGNSIGGHFMADSLKTHLGVSSVFDVLVMGAGASGLVLALELASLGGIRVRVVERRICRSGASERWHWIKPAQFDASREQVVSLRDDVVDLFQRSSVFTREGEHLLAGSTVWPASRNVSMLDLETRLLARVQESDLAGRIELVHGPPDDIWDALLEDTQESLQQYSKWLESFDADVVVAADGSESYTRRAYDATFQWASLASRLPRGEIAEKDHMLSVILDDDPAVTQSALLRMALSSCSTRYAFNAAPGVAGCLGIRLTPDEYSEVLPPSLSIDEALATSISEVAPSCCLGDPSGSPPLGPVAAPPVPSMPSRRHTDASADAAPRFVRPAFNRSFTAGGSTPRRQTSGSTVALSCALADRDTLAPSTPRNPPKPLQYSFGLVGSASVANNARAGSFGRMVSNEDAKRAAQLPLPLRPDSDCFKQTLREGLRLFGYSERHVRSVTPVACTPAYAKRFVHRSRGRSFICLIGEAAMSPHYWHGRGLSCGLRAASALARALRRSGSDADLERELARFDAFMRDLREREMEGCSAAMLLEGSRLPAWLDECVGFKLGRGPPDGSRTAELMQEACVRRSELDRELAQRVRQWRDYHQARWGAAGCPHPPLTDEEIDAALQTNPERQRPLTSLIMVASAFENPPFSGGGGSLRGLPISRQLGTRRVQGEVSPALEHQGLADVFRSTYTWDVPT